MTLVETQHRLALEQLRAAGQQPVSVAALRAAGLDAPAAVISELQLNGYAIERVYEHSRLLGVRVIEPEHDDTAAKRRRHWWSRRRRYRPALGGQAPATPRNPARSARRD